MDQKSCRVAIYARFSSEQQDSATIETQIQECTRKADSLQGTVVKIYREEAQSGRVEDRPAFQRMIEEALRKPRSFDVIIVRKFDRFARDVEVSRKYKLKLRIHGIKVISALEAIDSETAAGNLLEVMLEGIAEFYSKNLAAETKSGQATNTRRGFRSGGEAPYGYKNKRVFDPATQKTRTVLEINEDESPVLRFIFHRYSEGARLKTIMAELREKGLKPRKAKAWAPNTISFMLHHEVYIGTNIWRMEKDPATWVRVPNSLPVLVDHATWTTVQARLARCHVSQRPRSVSQSQHPLAGMIVCGECGGSFVIGSNPGNRGWYMVCRSHRDTRTCGNRRHIKEVDLVGSVKDVLLEKILTPANVRTALELYKKEIGDSAKTDAEELTRQQRQLAATQKHESDLMDELHLGDIPREVVKRKLLELADSREKIKGSIERLPEKVGKVTAIEVSENDVRDFVGLLKNRLNVSEGRQLRELLETLHLKVRVCKDVLKIETATDFLGDRPNGLIAGSPGVIISTRRSIPRRPDSRFKVGNSGPQKKIPILTPFKG
jgi:site-specific DNA recombinase